MKRCAINDWLLFTGETLYAFMLIIVVEPARARAASMP